MAVVSDLFTADPHHVHALYAELRDADEGVHLVEGANFWMALRYDDVAEIYRQREIYSSDVFWKAPVSVHDADDPIHQHFIATARRLIIFQDAPDHTRLRGLVRHAFTPKAVKSMTAAVERVSDELIAGLQTGAEIEFMTDFAEVLPVWAIAEMLGVPIADRAQFRTLSYAFASTLDPACQGEARDAAIRGAVELIEYLEALIDDRRSALGEDIISLLVQAEEDGDRLTADELAAMVAMLLVAGNETTTHLLANGLALLFDNPEQFARLRAQPELIDSALEEMLRYEPPLRWNARVATRDVELGGQSIEAGQMVWVCIAAANRDPRHFDAAESFDIARQENRHLAFGSGMHYGIGAPLARLEGRIAMPRLLERFPGIARGEEDATYRPDFIARGFDRFPVRLG